MEEISTLEFELAAGVDCSASISSTKLSSDDSPSLVLSSLGWYSASESSLLCLDLFFSGEMTVLAANNVDSAGIPSACSLELFLMHVLMRDSSIGCSGASKMSEHMSTNYYVYNL